MSKLLFKIDIFIMFVMLGAALANAFLGIKLPENIIIYMVLIFLAVGGIAVLTEKR